MRTGYPILCLWHPAANQWMWYVAGQAGKGRVDYKLARMHGKARQGVVENIATPPESIFRSREGMVARYGERWIEMSDE